MNFGEIVLQYWPPAFLAFFATFFSVIAAFFLFPRLGLMDRPHLYGLKRKPIPYYGGVILFLVFSLCLFVFVPFSKQVFGFWLGAFLITAIGFLDDKFNVRPLYRLIVQFCAALCLVFAGVGILSINLPFFGVLDLAALSLSALFTIVWVMVIVNSMNLVDGISGIGSGVAGVAGLTLFFLSIHPQIHENPISQAPVALMALIFGMMAMAFFIFDFPPAKILMGDTGSTLLGFILAGLAIFSGGKVATVFLVLGLPILDMVWTVIRRTLARKPFWHGDLQHLHHRLLDASLSPETVVVIYVAVTTIFGALAVHFVSNEQKFFMILALLLLMALLVASLVLLPKRK